MKPIYIFWTRSFWFGILPALIVGLDFFSQLVSLGGHGAIAGLVATAFGLPREAVETVMPGIAALAALTVAWQRKGAARPYTINPQATE